MVRASAVGRPASLRRAAKRLAVLLVLVCAGSTTGSLAETRSERPRRLSFPNVDVSAALGPQAEVRVAADPNRPSHLVAASNSDGDPEMRVYTSSDGGRTWTSQVLPLPPRSAASPCHADPAPAIDGEGNEYVAFIQAAQSCEEGGEHVTIRLAVRPADERAWHYRSESVFSEDPSGSFDDNPWLGVDGSPRSPHYGRLYLGWFRSLGERRLGFQLSHSDDHGLHWSAPKVVSDSTADPGYPSISVAADGAVYVAWQDFARSALYMDRSSDGGDTFGRDVVVRVRGGDDRDCPNGRPIPAQVLRCVRSDPTVLADSARNRVYLTYSDRARNGSEDLYVSVFSSTLTRVAVFPRRIGSRERKPVDQFWPTSALDEGRGRVVLCFYSSGTGRARVRATFSCAASASRGRRWSGPRAIASVASDETRPGASEFAYGDYEGLAVSHGVAHPMWTDSRDLARRGEEIYTAAFPISALSASAPPRQVDVSNAPGAQNEAAIAVDPTNPETLIASANSFGSPMSVYTSQDGGATWSSAAVPPDRPNGRCVGDPALTIDSRGREYLAFLRDSPCGVPGTPTALGLATRGGPSGRWSVSTDAVAGPLQPNESNDKPAITSDTSTASPFNGRVYIAWARAVGSDVHSIVVSHSDDGGRTWSSRSRVDTSSVDSGYPSIGTGPGGEVYVAWHPFEEDRILIAASFDGGGHFGPAQTIDVKRERSTCPASWPIPAQARRCVRPNPIVSVDSSNSPDHGRVYVTYENKAADGTQDVYVAAFDRSLGPRLGAPAGRRKSVLVRRRPVHYRTDQFWPSSAVDARTGMFWVCFYDTAGDRSRRRAWFSCTRSGDGGVHWSPIKRAATRPSDATRSWISPLQYGDYEAVTASAGVAHPVWTDTRRGVSKREEIYTTELLAH